MILKSGGFVLRLTPFRENSQIVTIFTEEFGVRSFLIRSVYWTKRSNKSASLQLLNQVEVVFYERQTRDIQLVSGVSLLRHYESFYENPQRGVYLQLWVEVLGQLLFEAGPQPEVYQWFSRFLSRINQSNDFVFEQTILGLSALARLMGYFPEIDNTWENHPVCVNGTLGIFEKTSQDSAEIVPQLIVNLILQESNKLITNKIPKTSRLEVLRCWFKVFQVHVPHFKEPKSLLIWEAIWKDLNS